MNNSESPIISVIMPVYNGEKYLHIAIESILNQSYDNFELIIFNDNSTDTSKEIILSYSTNDSRIVFVDKQKNVGPATLRNEGIDISKGEFIALLDADDIAMPTRLEKQLKIMQANPKIGVCGSWFTNFGQDVKTKVVKHPEFHDKIKVSFLIDCTIGNSTSFFRKNILEGVRYNNEYVPVEDFYFWSQLIIKTQFYIIQESLVNYRIHENNISQTKIDNVQKSRRRVKIEFLSEFGIDNNHKDIDSFYNLIEGQSKLSLKEIIKISECDSYLKIQNKKTNNFNDDLLNKMLNKSMSRIIRKSNKPRFTLINFIKKNKPEVIKNMSYFNKFKLYFKVLNLLLFVTTIYFLNYSS